MIARNAALTCVALTALLPGRIPCQEPPLIPFQLTRLELEVRVDYERAALTGRAVLHLSNVSAHAVSEVPLLLNRLMTVSSVEGLDGVALPFQQDVVVFQDDSMRQVNAAVVRLGGAVTPGDSVAVVVRYGGRLVGYTETGSLYIRDHIDHAFTILREDAYAFPTLGVPSWSAIRAMAREPFAFSLEVAVPADLVVATGGQGLGTRSRDSTTTWTYRSEAPVPFLNIAIAPYRTLDEGGVRIFYLPEDSAGAGEVQRAVRGAVAQYTEWFGSLRQDIRLTVIEIPEGWGSQASLSAGIIETVDAFRDRAQRYQLYHELSHLWNAPDRDRPSPRWNEGLASFLQWRMAAQLDGWSGWDAWRARTEASLKARCAPRTPCATVPFALYGRDGLTGASYPVGSLMFYLLYQALGREAFDRTYRQFFQRFRDQGATTSDLVAAFKAASPVGERIVSEWLLTTRWNERLASGQSVRDMLDEYVAQRH